MKMDATESDIERVVSIINELGFRAHTMPGATRTAIGITGNQGAVDVTRFENLPGVAEAIRVSKPYKLITLDLRPEKTVVRVGDAKIGGDELDEFSGTVLLASALPWPSIHRLEDGFPAVRAEGVLGGGAGGRTVT